LRHSHKKRRQVETIDAAIADMVGHAAGGAGLPVQF